MGLSRPDRRPASRLRRAVERWPTALLGDLTELGIGVDDHRISHSLEHRQIGDGVAIEVGFLPTALPGLHEPLSVHDLALAVAQGLDETAEDGSVAVPELIGFSPKSDCMIAFSTAAAALLSNTDSASVRASSAKILASCFRGVSVP